MGKEKKFITCDGNYAAAYVSYMFSEVAAIYPITPSSTMAEYVDEWAANDKKNIFGETVKVVEMQSEGGAAGAVHGSLQSGALTSTYTASQGLLLMLPNMFKIAGELLPGVFHVSARSLAAQALSIFGDHSDVMAVRSSGFAQLATGSVQEVMDLGGVAHLAAIKSRVPFVHFFDGFRTSHEIQKIEAIDTDSFKALVDWKAVEDFRKRALSNEHPVTRGTAQNPDVYFQNREASNPFYNAVPEIVEQYMAEITKLTGREYHLFDYYGAADATDIIVAMGSVADTTREVVNYLMKQGRKVGLLIVRLYRPFSAKHFLKVLPKTVKRIAVLDRTKEPGAMGEPLYNDVKALFYEQKEMPVIVGGRYGLSSKDTTPAQLIAVYDNLALPEPKDNFTIGIVDDVTFLSLPQGEEVNMLDENTFQGKFYGLGSDGTVGANKNSIKIIGESTNKYCQAYFAYDSKKSGGITTSHLRFGDTPIHSPYLVTTPNFVACHVPAYIYKYDMLRGITEGGSFLLNCSWTDEEIHKFLPNSMKAVLAKKKIHLYAIDGTTIAREVGLGSRTNTIMQSAFFKIANVIPYEKAVEEMKHFIEKSFGKKGADVVKMNCAAVDRGGEYREVPVPADWASLTPEPKASIEGAPEFVNEVALQMNNQLGDDLPVSAFTGYEDGTIPSGTTQWEKRGIAVMVPEWQAENCIQCNQCAYVCPHAAIRPFLLTDEEVAKAPAGTTVIDGKGPGLSDYKFRMQVSVLDCTGCGNCADVCPAKNKALEMKLLETQQHLAATWDYMDKKVGYKSVVDKFKSVKNSQFEQPLFEFSGACAGCGETPYIKTITQLYGDHMMVANATGCSSIYGGSSPSSPYRANAQGRGVAWANSLFEDNAEFGLGIYSGIEKLRERVAAMAEELKGEKSLKAETVALLNEYLEKRDCNDESQDVTNRLSAALASESAEGAKELLKLQQYFSKKSMWIFGGDGWAYDIGYGGLDHVLASGENVKVLVLDTEVYSNTGGQASKSTPVAAVAKFAAAGKRVRKKDLGMMAMSYGYVYVAQVAMGADQNQYFKALKEAEAYPGPALIIAYAPCINHGLRKGMGKSQMEEKLAVACGYWHLYRYNPLLEAEGKNPFALDSKPPKWEDFRGFLDTEVRYTSLEKGFPAEAGVLFQQAEQNARWRYNNYVRLSKMDFSQEA
ncbi:MAG: pyruvate:ferredoxin (flavodoxin) oxidoreductase [Bacteroidia bacterium]|nr:MAG: pyruvate:ferredoxin (flavodoxin) oxidoreductase [Bacteroidia bacterium]